MTSLRVWRFVDRDDTRFQCVDVNVVAMRANASFFCQTEFSPFAALFRRLRMAPQSVLILAACRTAPCHALLVRPLMSMAQLFGKIGDNHHWGSSVWLGLSES